MLTFLHVCQRICWPSGVAVRGTHGRRESNSFIESCSVLMGIGEAGYYAGVIYYLSFWYKRYVAPSLDKTCYSMIAGANWHLESGWVTFLLVQSVAQLF